jgi:hypothetical protein
MSSTYAEPLDRLDGVLDELRRSARSSGPSPRGRSSAADLAGDLRAEAERSSARRPSDDIAEETGDRSTAAWLATQTRDNHGTVRRHAALAASLGRGGTRTADGAWCRRCERGPGRVIVEALEVLPDELGDDLVVKAEAYLVEQAAVFGPRELRHLGRGVLEHLAPRESPTRPSTSGCSPRRPAPRPRRVCRSRPAVTGRPTCTPGSPTTSRTGCGPTWTPTPPLAAPPRRGRRTADRPPRR